MMEDLVDQLAASQDIQAMIGVGLIILLVVTLMRYHDQIKVLRRQVDELMKEMK